MKYISKNKGFTLVEALIAISIFVILGTLTSTMYVFNVRNYNHIKAQKELVDDAQFIVERIAKELQSSTIDYEEYFNMVAGGGGGVYGDAYGDYAEAFYENGVNTGQNPNLENIMKEILIRLLQLVIQKVLLEGELVEITTKIITSTQSFI